MERVLLAYRNRVILIPDIIHGILDNIFFLNKNEREKTTVA